MTDNERPRRNGRMLRWGLGGVLLLTGVLAAAKWLPRTEPPKSAAAIQASLELAAGEVLVDAGRGQSRAVSGTALASHSRIVTNKGARALVRLADGTTLFLRDNTEIVLEADKVVLERGEYWVDAPPTERALITHSAGAVALAAAEAGFSLRRQGDEVTTYVARGLATVTAPGGRVEVHSGEQALTRGTEAPKTQPVTFWEDWTGGLADFASGRGAPGAGSGTIYGVDQGAPPGTPARHLELAKQGVTVRLRDGLSQTEVDQTFFNPGDRTVEGWYWFTLPERANVTGFGVETDGQLVWGELIEKKEAAVHYGVAKATGHAPAILEWVDSHTYRARIFPVEAGKSRRVILRYIEAETIIESRLEYVYPMASREPARIGEFSLMVDLGDAGTRMKIATLADARVEEGGKRVTLRRSGYTPRADFRLVADLTQQRPPLAVARQAAPSKDSADYLMVRYTPDIDFSKIPAQRADVVVVVDTSAGGDESTRQLETATAEAILRALSDEDRFALVSLDAKPIVLHPQTGLAPASDAEISRALEALAGHSSGGATDLAAMFDVSLGRLHGTEQPAVIYVGDGVATTGEMTPEQLNDRLRRALSTSRARLFTVGVGNQANESLLGELARSGGGKSFHVDQPEETTARALNLAAALKIPTITDFEMDLGAGLDEPFSSALGKVSRGEEVTVLARTHHDLPPKIRIRGRVGGSPFEKNYDVAKESSLLTSFVPRLWAAEYVRRLMGSARGVEGEKGRIVSLGLDYGLMTPHTSLLALESEAAYGAMGIERKRSKLRGEILGARNEGEERHFVTPTQVIGGPLVQTGLGCSLSKDDAPSSANARYDMAMEKEAKPSAPSEPPSPTQAPIAAASAAMPSADDGSNNLRDQPESAPKTEARAAASPVGREEAELSRKANARSGGAGPAGAEDFAAGLDARRPKTPEARPASIMAPRPAGQAHDELLLGSPKGAKKPFAIGRVAGGEEKVPPAAPPPPSPLAERSTCSDAAERPLGERVLLWHRRLTAAQTPEGLVERYQSALRACELPDWLAERTFLYLLQRHLDSERAMSVVLGHFAGRPEVQKYLARLVLRRAVDQRLVTAVETALFGGGVNWLEVDLDLSATPKIEDRLRKVREAMARAPDDPNGGIRLVKLLMESNQTDEALTLGRRLRDQGFVTPRIAQELGDVLAQAGRADEAVRTYSEIVEFDPENLESRRLLGDIYLGHGWYEPAYRQYKTLTESLPEDSLAWLRLAAAAAGAGRVDEALRLERKVSSAQGTPGPDDPRRWARLISAARLAQLIHALTGNEADKRQRRASLERKLQELQLFSGQGSLVIVTWEDLSRELSLVTRVNNQDSILGDPAEASQIGLSARFLAPGDLSGTTFLARQKGAPSNRALALTRLTIRWDGKQYHVEVQGFTLPSRAAEITL